MVVYSMVAYRADSKLHEDLLLQLRARVENHKSDKDDEEARHDPILPHGMRKPTCAYILPGDNIA